MESRDLVAIREQAETPSFVLHLGDLRRNAQILREVKEAAGCKILLALKGFANFRTFGLFQDVLDGACASSFNEARLGREEFGGEVGVFSPAYRDQDIEGLLGVADNIIFNSFAQLRRYRERILTHVRTVEIGLRINPEHSEGAVDIYNPCARFSRLGIPISQWDGDDLDGVTGLHFHTLCEQNSDALEATLAVVEAKWGDWLPKMSWVNFGGGHHITRGDYDRARLIRLIRNFRQRYDVDVYLEPGEAVALNAGVFVTQVVDLLYNERDIAILDCSAQCHLPDVLEMPYRPEIVGAGMPGEYAHSYLLGGQTCLAGDVFGEWSFPEPLKPGDRLIFTDMAHYTMVKTNTFNGINLPTIAHFEPKTQTLTPVRQFGYHDFHTRLG
ncbi:MAG: carboxynorspermidine decarboxylase [Opitutales bacterium]|nr:carboxynorspermidine decarboxylase [Opitutales bacterium]NRA27493.1 carboxynorspermidine decarboxylase [Opitutales bacterium]